MIAGIGHNAPRTYEEVRADALETGLYRIQRDALGHCVDDPRMGVRHMKVLWALIKYSSSTTGEAFPGRSRLAAEITYHVNGEPRRYSEASIRNAISDLMAAGYVLTTRKAPGSGGRALAHYIATVPVNYEAEIASFCENKRLQEYRSFPTDVHTRRDVSNSSIAGQKGADVPTSMDDRGADVPTRSDVPTSIDVPTTMDITALTSMKQVADVHAGVTQEPVGTRRKNISPTPLDEVAQPPVPAATSVSTQGKPKKSRRKAADVEGTYIDPNWCPTAEDLAWVRERYAATDRQLAREIEKFRTYHIERGSVRKSWPGTWRTWWMTGYHKIPERKDAPTPQLLDLVRDEKARELAAMEAQYERDMELAGRIARGEYDP